MNLRFVAFLFILFLCVCSIVSHFVPNPSEDYKHNKGYSWEEYDSSYFLKFQTVQSIIDSADSHFGSTGRNTIAYYDYVSEIVRKRFYHGYSYYSFSENPLAFLSGKIGSSVSAIVAPSDIMKHPMAACSQQSLVMMDIFRRTGIDYRKIGFTGHFAAEAFINGKWEYFDTNMEPNFQNRRESLHDLLATNRFDSIYSNIRMNSSVFHKATSHPQYGKINKQEGLRILCFHRVCFLLESRILLLTLLFLSILSMVRFSTLRELISRNKEEFA